MKKTYSKKINEWELDIEYQYIPAEEATHDYPGYGSHIEIQAIYLWNEKYNTSTDEQVDMSEFFYELCPDVIREIEDEITEDYEDS